MKSKGACITVEVGITVSRRMAERCLRLLEIYNEDHPHEYFLLEMDKYGHAHMSIHEKTGMSSRPATGEE